MPRWLFYCPNVLISFEGAIPVNTRHGHGVSDRVVVLQAEQRRQFFLLCVSERSALLPPSLNGCSDLAFLFGESPRHGFECEPISFGRVREINL
jgi:hypothetical protein